jgi:hypothetical protein
LHSQLKFTLKLKNLKKMRIEVAKKGRAAELASIEIGEWFT